MQAISEAAARLEESSRPDDAKAMRAVHDARLQAYRRARPDDPVYQRVDARAAFETARRALNETILSDAQAKELLARLKEAMPRLSGERAPLHALGIAQ